MATHPFTLDVIVNLVIQLRQSIRNAQITIISKTYINISLEKLAEKLMLTADELIPGKSSHAFPELKKQRKLTSHCSVFSFSIWQRTS